MSDILQRTEVMQTHLGVLLQEEHANDWTVQPGSAELNLDVLYSYPKSSSPFDYEQAYWGYRGQAGIAQMVNDSGILLDGSTGYVTMGNVYSAVNTSPFSLGIWVYIVALPSGSGMIFSKNAGLGSGGGYDLMIDNAGRVSFRRMSNSVTDTAISATGVVQAGGSYFIAMTYSGTTIKIYVNGVEVASQASTILIPGGATPFVIGRNSAGSANFLNGIFWYAWITGQAATPTQMADLYTIGTTIGQGPLFATVFGYTNPLSQWTLSQYGTATQLDFIGSVNGTATGGYTTRTPGSSWYSLGNTNRMYRYRIGDGSSGDRQVWGQGIYNPIGNATGWSSWAAIYSGSHYAIDVYRDVNNNINIIHAKSDGLYLNNVKKADTTNIIRIHAIAGRPGSCYFITVGQDALDNKKVFTTYIVNDITASYPITPTYDKVNYRFPHMEMAAYQWIDGASNSYITKIRSFPYSSPNIRKDSVSDDLVQDYTLSANYLSDVGDIQSLRGASGRAGTKVIDRMWTSSPTAFPNGRAHLFFTERHLDSNNNPLSNLHSPAFWTTTGFSPDGWTEPQPLGFSLWDVAGAVNWGQYIIVAGNGLAAYKLMSPEQVDLSNYAVGAQLNLPRGHEKATGTVTLANPNDVVGQFLGMASDTLSPAPQKRVKVLICTRRSPEEGWEDVEVNDWWIAEAHRISEDNQKRVELRLGDFWQRLESQFRDPYYYPGRLEYEDWGPGNANTLSNWYADSGVLSTENATDGDGQTYLRMKNTTGFALSTRWKGANCYFKANFILSAAGGGVLLVFRWADKKNYWRLYYTGTNLHLQQIVNGTATTLQTTTVTANLTSFSLSVQARWGWIRYALNSTSGTYQETGTSRLDEFGFCGVWAKAPNYKIEYVDFADYEYRTTTSSLVKALLIYAGYTQFTVSDDLRDIDQMAVLWGPQTDIPTPARALERLLEGNRQDVLWRSNPSNGRGEIVIDQFETLDSEYDIDEEIISVDQADISEVRPNVVLVDGQEDSWTEYSRSDLRTRGAAVNEYFDLPELANLTAVRAKAQEEKTLAAKGNSLGGLCVWRPWFARMDSVAWHDHDDNVYLARIEGMDLDIAQGATPFQHVQLDLAPVSLCDPEADESGLGPGSGGSGDGGEIVTPADFLALDNYQKDDVSSSWGSAVPGGSWTLSGSAFNFSILNEKGRIQQSAVASERTATLGSGPNTSSPVYAQMRFQLLEFANEWVALGLIFRYINSTNFYYATVRIHGDRTVKVYIYKRVSGVDTIIFNAGGVISGFPVYTTSHVNLKVWVSGTSPTKIYMKLWKTTSPEPDSWQYAVFDSSSPMQAAGKFGVRFYISSGTTSGQVTVDFETFRITNAPAA